jgi:hypothetical protein
MKVHEFHNFVNQESELFRILRHLPRPDENGPWLAGGSVWKAIENLPIDCDIDFFFKNEAQYEEYVRKLKSIPYTYHIVTEKKNKYNTTFGFHIYEKGYNKTIPVQFVSFRLCNSLEELLSGFDFTVCQFGFDGHRLYTGDTAFDDLKTRTIKFNNVRDTAATAIHVKKYLDRGFTIPPDQQKRFEEMMMLTLKTPSDKPLFERLEELERDGYPQPRATEIRLGSNDALVGMDEPISIPEPAPGLVYAPYIPLTVNTVNTVSWGTTPTISNVITSS